MNKNFAVEQITVILEYGLFEQHYIDLFRTTKNKLNIKDSIFNNFLFISMYYSTII